MQKTKKPSCPLAIIGIGCLFPRADNLADYWHNIREGVDAITDIPESHWDPADYFDDDQKKPDMTYAHRGGFINPVDFNPMQYGISPNDIEAIDTAQLLGLVVARQALLDAGYATSGNADDGKKFDRDRAGVIMGVTSALELLVPLSSRLGHPIWRRALADAGIDPETAEDVVQRIAESYVPWQENSFPGLLGNVVAGRIANRFDLGGTNCVVDAACASSLSAIHLAAMELETGRADMVVSGGVDTFNDIFMYMCFSKTPALSPTGDSRPFAADGDGTILGEGIGAVILKRLEDAQGDGDKIYAVLKGIGSSSDGRGNAIYAPNATGQVKALQRAYEQAGVEPDSIELIEAHGTGTVVGDAVEIEALQQIYRKSDEQQPWCAIGSVKSMIGHTKAAAGIAGMIKTIMALKHQVLPPSIKVEQPLELLTDNTPFYLNTIKRPWISSHAHPRRAALSAFGFGGSNFHCVLEEAEGSTNAVKHDGQILLFALSATSKEQLLEQLTAIKTDRPWLQQRAGAALSCTKFDNKQPHRMVLVIEKDSTDLDTLIREATDLLSQPETQQSDPYFLEATSGISYASGSHEHKTGLLFPGQGAQYVGMFRDLACQDPQFRDVLSTANEVQDEHRPGFRLSDIIYPIPVFSDELEKQQQDILRDTCNAQPAIGAVSLAALRVLEQFDFEADIIAGHSYGELVALCAAGILGEHDLHQLSQLRGKLMSQNEGDRGAMLAVLTTLEQVRQLIGDGELDVTVANHNAPEQIILSGASEQIDNARAFFKQHKIVSKPLPVAAAFHSEFVADAEQPFMEALAEIELRYGKKTVLSNTTADCYPSEQQQIKELLAGQLARPVRFVEQIEKMYQMGVRTFVEVGPGSRLSGLVNSILKGKEFQMLAIDHSAGRRHGRIDLAAMLAGLAVLGKVDLSSWDRDYATDQAADEQKKSMTIKLSGANYVIPREKEPPQAIQDRPPAMTAADDQQAPNAVHENIMTLQKMQEQTAKLHQQYLEGQQVAQQTITQMLQQITPGNMPPLPADPGDSSAALTPETPAQTAQLPTQAATPGSTEPFRADHQEAAPPAQTEEISSILLKIIAEKTGYPSEMLNLDMGLDNDLGIDSIKRVEILSALQERLPDMPTVEPEKLATFESLKDITEFLSATVSPQPVPEPSLQSGDDHDDVGHEELQQILLEVIADKTGYPSEMLNLDMSLDDDLGIDSIKRVEILSALREKLPQTRAPSAEDLGTLQTLRQIVEYISDSDEFSTEEAPTKEQTEATAEPVSDEPVPDQPVPETATDKAEEELSIDLSADKFDLITEPAEEEAEEEQVEAAAEPVPETATDKEEEKLSIDLSEDKFDLIIDPGEEEAEEEQVEAAAEAVTDKAEEELSIDLGEDKLDLIIDPEGEKAAEEQGEAAAEAVTDKAEEELSIDLGEDKLDLIIEPEEEEAAAESATDKAEEELSIDLGEDKFGLVIEPEEEEAAEKQVEAVAEAVPDKPIADEIPLKKDDKQDDRALSRALQRQVLSLAPLKEHGKAIALPDGTRIAVLNAVPDLASAIKESLTGRGLSAEVISMDVAADPTLAGLIITVPKDPDKNFMKDSFLLLQKMNKSLRQAGKSKAAILVSVTQLGGKFGLRGIGDAYPVSGGIAGLIKTAAREWPEVSCKAIDIANSDKLDKLADGIADECLVTGPVEVGLSLSKQSTVGRFTLKLNSAEINTQAVVARPLQSGDVVVVTGGARGVTAEIALALAKTYQTNLLLLGRSREPEEEAEWLKGMTSEGQIKTAIIDEKTRQGVKKSMISPRIVESIYRKILAERDVRNNLQYLKETGVKVMYRVADVRDDTDVITAIAEARKSLGKISGIVHGAGVLADRLIEDKTEEQFSLVYDTKVAGITALLAATEKDPLKTIVMFSSSTGRFGRVGQSDYAIANEVLNKIAQQQAAQRQDCRVLSVNWGPWDGGMVTPALKKMFDREGIGLIPLQAGADYLMQEIAYQGPTEIITLGRHEKDTQNKQPAGYETTPAAQANDSRNRDQNSGQNSDDKIRTISVAQANAIKNRAQNSGDKIKTTPAAQTNDSQNRDQNRAQNNGDKIKTTPAAQANDSQNRDQNRAQNNGDKIKTTPAEQTNDSQSANVTADSTPVVLTLKVNITDYPFLQSHVINSRAVLPVAMIIEWLSHGALHNNPNLICHGFKDLRIFKGITLASNETIELNILANQADDDPNRIAMELRHENTLHAGAEITLSADNYKAEKASHAKVIGQYSQADNKLYSLGRLFHGELLHGIQLITGCNDSGISAKVRAASAPGLWMKNPLRSQWLSDPLILDSSFQMMILWTFEQFAKGSLPTAIGEYRQFREKFPPQGCQINISITECREPRAVADIEFIDNNGLLIARIKDYECMMDDSLKQAFSKNKLSRETVINLYSNV